MSERRKWAAVPNFNFSCSRLGDTCFTVSGPTTQPALFAPLHPPSSSHHSHSPGQHLCPVPPHPTLSIPHHHTPLLLMLESQHWAPWYSHADTQTHLYLLWWKITQFGVSNCCVVINGCLFVWKCLAVCLHRRCRESSTLAEKQLRSSLWVYTRCIQAQYWV